MKITAIRTVICNAQMRNWVFVRVETDQPGLYGWGEATLEWKTRAVVGAVEDLAPLVRGRDPRDIEQNVRILTNNIAQPDLCRVGGFTEGRKIAAMADTVGVGIAPHNPLGPLAGVAALHFDIATPNFVIQEEMSGVVPWYHDVVDGPIRMRDGHWQVPERAGLGVEVNEAVAVKHPFEQEVLHATHAVLPDGTVVDW